MFLFFLILISSDTISGTSDQRVQHQLYSDALKAMRENDLNDSLILFESFVHQYPRSDLADNALYWMAQIYLQKNERALAKAELERIIQNYPKGDRLRRALGHLKVLEESSATSRQQKDAQP